MISLIKNKKYIESGTNCSVAGWGSLRTNGSASDCLMEATVKIKNNTECEGRWQGIYSVSKMMCAYSRGGSCDVCTKDDSQTLIIYKLSFTEIKFKYVFSHVLICVFNREILGVLWFVETLQLVSHLLDMDYAVMHL